ncbi:Gamma-aminobutyric acid type B receptor subunit 1 [Eumeta japonica]|uniref:Gamma-aminobutyric acid type B receptor subunit 1 n=1 Tax=Eumeta variegata TaxID=151549 RepID=A0A4C1SR76_EUMVA|nr:Gamma-aminobutyric acid type B receptor subunit 1 [Eumeta japonica]
MATISWLLFAFKQCEPGLGASVMYNLLYNKPQKLMLLAGCGTVYNSCRSRKMWNLIVLCYGASSPALSDRSRFPTLFRTHPSATVHNPTRIKLMKNSIGHEWPFYNKPKKFYIGK